MSTNTREMVKMYELSLAYDTSCNKVITDVEVSRTWPYHSSCKIITLKQAKEKGYIK